MVCEAVNPALVRKYNRPVPRYTSYPTVPFWNDTLDKAEWQRHFKIRFDEENAQNGISLYIHLPFCESLCTYCGCNKRITTNHSVEEVYLEYLKKEWALYQALMNQAPVIRELHLGGGTPTFFSPLNLKRLLEFILKNSLVHPRHEFSIEGHPNNTTDAHLRMLYTLGFRRISYGVQDNDPDVQRVINRIQPFENVKAATENARAAGFTSVNFDLIYGLPLQTLESMERTIKQTLTVKPDRIAFYSYAHVPWVSKAQRLFDESHLPSAELKLQLYLKGKQLLLNDGYVDIGMDHFALPTDDLYTAWIEGTLHRNFMGYTPQATNLLLGLGVSSISDSGDAYAQNTKTLHEYYEAIHSGNLAIKKGYILNTQDGVLKKYILDISCKGETSFKDADVAFLKEHTFPKLLELEQDGLLHWNEKGLKLTPQGRYFIRNVCSAFDVYLDQATTGKQIFSKAV
ncbi:MAG TPA: oxygen-independent coproporphyrinogen III oxidase [Chitinophagaceae bacterium]|nr:oxygen-independent coproporphyrinogen III oxidase [Chitinophagaceae bacterium]